MIRALALAFTPLMVWALPAMGDLPKERGSLAVRAEQVASNQFGEGSSRFRPATDLRTENEGIDIFLAARGLAFLLAGTTNLQGRFSNDSTSDPCLTVAPLAPEPGRFIHLEQEPGLRQNATTWQSVVKAFKCAFP